MNGDLGHSLLHTILHVIVGFVIFFPTIFIIGFMLSYTESSYVPKGRESVPLLSFVFAIAQYGIATFFAFAIPYSFLKRSNLFAISCVAVILSLIAVWIISTLAGVSGGSSFAWGPALELLIGVTGSTILYYVYEEIRR